MVRRVATGLWAAHLLFCFHLENLKTNKQTQTQMIHCSQAPSADQRINRAAQRINNLFPALQMC